MFADLKIRKKMNLRKISIIFNLIIPLFVAHELPAYPQNQYLYVGSTFAAGATTICSTASNTEVGIGQLPTVVGTDVMVITADGQHAYTATPSFSSVSYFNLTDNTLKATIALPNFSTIGDPQLALTPDGQYLIATRRKTGGSIGTLYVISTATNTIVANQDLTNLPVNALTYPLAISPIFSTNYTVFVGTTSVTNTRILPLTINVSTGTPILGSFFTVGTNSNAGLAITPNGSTLYVVNNPAGVTNRRLFPVNTSTFAVGTAITITGDTHTASTVAITPNGNTAYVITGNTGTAGNVNVINLNTQLWTQTVAGAGGTVDAGVIPSCPFSADASYLYVPNFNNASSPALVQVINTATNTLATQISVTVDPNVGLSFAAIRQSLGGTLDTTFGNHGYTLTPLSRADTVQGLAIQSNDNILITGTTQTTAPSLYLARYTANGILDSSFNAASTPGYFIFAPTALTPTASACAGNAIALDANQKILVAGYAAQSPTTLLLARFTTTGTLDTTTFNNPNGFVTQSVGTGEGITAAAVGVQSATHSNRIIVAGTSINNGIPSFTLAAFNASTGALDTSFGGTGTGYRIDTLGNISILKAMVIPGASATYADNIFVAGIVDGQAVVTSYGPTGNLLQTYSPIGDIANPSIGGGPTISSSAAYDLTYIDTNHNGNTESELYVAGSAIVAGSTNPQSFIFDVLILPSLSLSPWFNGDSAGDATPTGFILQSISAGSEFYSITTQPNNNIVAGGYAVGLLANQLSLANYQGFTMSQNEGGSFPNGFPYGTPNYYWNNGTGSSLTTIGSLTAAQKVRCQSTGQVITAGTADGTYCIARFNGDSTTAP